MQDAFLHWQAADRQRIKVPEAWLTKVITNLCLDGTRPAGRA
ncbi:sigma factor [Nonomuraea angiospora]